MKHIKFYMQHGPRGMQPLAVEVDAHGRGVQDADGYANVLSIGLHPMGMLTAHFPTRRASEIGRGWIRITEAQARDLDKKFNYSSTEPLYGHFFGYGPLTDMMSAHFGYQQWQEYLDPGMEANQFRVLAPEIRTGDQVELVYYKQVQGKLHEKKKRGMVVNIASRLLIFDLQDKTSSRLYSERELITVYKEEKL